MPAEAHSTPNPNARKYTLPHWRFDKPLNISSQAAALAHPLAVRLFDVPGVYNVFMVQDFVTINKLPDVTWEDVELPVLAILNEFLTGFLEEQ